MKQHLRSLLQLGCVHKCCVSARHALCRKGNWIWQGRCWYKGMGEISQAELLASDLMLCRMRSKTRMQRTLADGANNSAGNGNLTRPLSEFQRYLHRKAPAHTQPARLIAAILIKYLRRNTSELRERKWFQTNK